MSAIAERADFERISKWSATAHQMYWEETRA